MTIAVRLAVICAVLVVGCTYPAKDCADSCLKSGATVRHADPFGGCQCHEPACGRVDGGAR